MKHVPASPEPGEDQPFLKGGGPTGALVRAFNWSQTPIGAPQDWPEPLKTLAGVMLAASQPMFVAWGPERTLIYNDAYAEILAGKHPSAIGRDFLEVWSEIRADLVPIVDQAYRGEPVQMDDIELNMLRKGFLEETHFSFFYAPVRDNTGNVGGLYCACTEITGQVLADRRRAADAERQKRLFEKAPGFIAILTGPDHTFEFVNEAYVQVAGQRDYIGRSVRQAFPDLEGQGLFETLDGVFASGERFVAEGTPVTMQASPDQPVRIVVLDFIYEPIRDENGRITGIFVEGHDVTATHLAQEALRESEQRFRNMADHAPVMMWVTDQTGYCTYLNRRWYEFTGQTQDDAEGFGWLEATHPDDKAEAGRIFQEAIAAQGPLRLEYRLRQADGAYHWCIDAASPRFGAGGEFLGYVGSVIDIEQRRAAELQLQSINDTLESRISAALEERARAEEDLRQAQKLEALGQLTGGVAHDFNNLLMIVQAGLNMLERRDDRAHRDMLVGRMREAVTRGANLTRQLLAFSRRQDLAPEAVDFVDHLSEMADLLDRSLGGDVHIALDLAGDLAPVFVDPNELQLALLNLSVNARDAMPLGGTITIRAENGADGDAAGDCVRISVIDVGEGMTPEVQARVFEPFFTTKDIGKGSGLGLAQVHGFARQSGGHVEIESAPGKGTRVTLVLPRSETRAASAHPPEPGLRADRAKGDAGHILLVEDDDEVGALIIEMLEHLGWHVTRASSAQAALGALANGRKVDLLFSDVMMPGGMNGVELAHAARARRPDLPVVLMSGYAENVSRDAEQSGIPLIAKPFSLDRLAAVLEMAQLN